MPTTTKMTAMAAMAHAHGLTPTSTIRAPAITPRMTPKADASIPIANKSFLGLFPGTDDKFCGSIGAAAVVVVVELSVAVVVVAVLLAAAVVVVDDNGADNDQGPTLHPRSLPSAFTSLEDQS